MAAYPCVKGQFVPAHELGLPLSRLDLRSERSWNNHHYAHPARGMGRLLITQTFRDLNRNQDLTPKDVHTRLHQVYEPPKLQLPDVMDVLDEAYQNEELLRYGPANRPSYREFSAQLLRLCRLEYEAIR